MKKKYFPINISSPVSIFILLALTGQSAQGQYKGTVSKEILNQDAGQKLGQGKAAAPRTQDRGRRPANVPTSEKVNPVATAIEEAKEAKKDMVRLSEISLKFSGFAWVESESSKNFGYNGASLISNFDSDSGRSSQDFATFFSNLQMDVAKGNTRLTAVFELGEIFNGDSASGGSAGGRQRILEARNLYLEHNFTSELNFKAGLQPLAADPNGYILSDHLASAVATYQKDELSLMAWAAKASDSKPGLASTDPTFVNRDQYFGVQGGWKYGETTKATAYGVSRRTRESFYDSGSATMITGSSEYNWLGATVDRKVSEQISAQATYIANQGKFQADANGSGDKLNAFLADVKLMATWTDQKMEFLLEGLVTSGSGNSVSAAQPVQTIGSRQGFSSPDPGAAYLLTIATSDGADDAPGAPKESIIGNLSQAEGLQIYVFKVSKSLSDTWSVFARVGVLRSTEDNADTGSSEMGHEFDISTTYELCPGTTLQFDYGTFNPGSYFAKKDPATLLTSRLKFAF